jgi:hypothetical protein
MVIMLIVTLGAGVIAALIAAIRRGSTSSVTALHLNADPLLAGSVIHAGDDESPRGSAAATD